VLDSVKQVARSTMSKLKSSTRSVNQTEKDREIVDLVRTLYRTRDERYNLELQWDFNRRFYAGKQDITIVRDRESGTQSITTLPETDYSTGININLILSTVTNRTSEIVKSRPIIFAKPKTDELSDSSKARVTNACARYAKDAFDFDSLNAEAYTLVQLTGKSFYKAYWDKTAGKEEEIELAPEIKTNEDGTQEEIQKTEIKKVGDIRVVIRPSDNILVSRNAQKMDDARWLLDFYEDDVERLVLLHPNFEKEIRAAKIAISLLDKIDSEKYTSPQPDHDRLCTVYELYMRPSKDYPNGLFAKVVGDFCLEQSDLPEGLWPFIELQEFPAKTGSFWPEAVVSQLIPLNRALNMHTTQMLAYQHKVCRAPVILYKGGGIKPNQVTNEASSTWECSSPAFRPDILLPPQMPGDMYATSNMLLSFFEEVSRVGKTSKGQNIPGGRSYDVWAAAKEQDERYMVSSAQYFERAQLNLSKLILRLMRLHYEDGRIMAFVGKNNIPEVELFKKDLIIEDDLDIEAFSSIPQSKTMVEQRVVNLTQAGIINPTQDRKAVLEALELSSLDRFNSDVLIDDLESEKENNFILQGKEPNVYKGQNHVAHIKSHNELVKRDEYKGVAGQPSQVTGQVPMGPAVPGQPPMMQERTLMVDEVRLNHIQDHIGLLIDETVQQQQIQGMIMQALGIQPQGGGNEPPQKGNQVPQVPNA
jgi:hypothetical protein